MLKPAGVFLYTIIQELWIMTLLIKQATAWICLYLDEKSLISLMTQSEVLKIIMFLAHETVLVPFIHI